MTSYCNLIGCCQGDWVDDERHGEGQFTFNTREVYDGKWVEDKISKFIFHFPFYFYTLILLPLSFLFTPSLTHSLASSLTPSLPPSLPSLTTSLTLSLLLSLQDGYGKITFASDDKYIGYWKDGMRHGKVLPVPIPFWNGNGSIFCQFF